MSHEYDRGMDMLIEQVKQFREDVKEDFALVRSEIHKTVSREAYQADKEATDRRISALERGREVARNALYGAIASMAVSVIMLFISIGR